MTDSGGGVLSAKTDSPVLGALAGPETAAEERIAIPARELELIQQIEAMRSGRAAQWKWCPTWNNGCRCVPVFKCQKGEATTRLDGPETAAEHVRNAMMLLDTAPITGHDVVVGGVIEVNIVRAARARLARALAALEGSSS